MTREECRTAVKTATDHDGASDTQVTTAQLNTWIDIEHKLLRRLLAQVAPQLYTAADNSQTISSGTESLTMPSDFERLIRLEIQVGDRWLPIEVSDELSPHIGTLAVREEGGTLKVAPGALTAGTYRIIYVQKPTTLSADSGAGGVLLVPDGCEDIIVEKVAARVRERLDEDPTPHLNRAAATWKEQKSALRRRYGKAPQPGMRTTRRW